MCDDADVTALKRRVSRYLCDNPLACDTSEGIARWWLGLDWVTHERGVDTALSQLVAAGQVECIRGPDGRVRYRKAIVDDDGSVGAS